jgi:hypothetical protein
MDKSLDDLFDDFFKRNKINPNDDINNELSDIAKKMIDMLQSFGELDSNNIDIDKINIEEDFNFDDNELGTPDKIEFFTEDDLYFERRIWYTENGEFVQLIISDEPNINSQTKDKKQLLEDKLEKAIIEENYEEAAKLRDEIIKIKKNN